MSKKYSCHKIAEGKAKAEAIITHDRIMFYQVRPEDGVMEEKNHELEGRSIAPYVRLIVTPASKAVYREAARRGYLKTLVQAGAMVTHPFCGLCQGRSGGLVSGDQVVIGTHNRNFIGRMGSPAARTYLASPAVAAASALEGRIADPAPYL